MNIGYYASGSLQDVLRRAARTGLDGVELAFSAGSSCDLDTWTDVDIAKALSLMAETGMKVLTVSSYWDQHMSPDVATRQLASKRMRRAIEVAAALGSNVVTCMAFADATKRPEEQVDIFGQVFGEYAQWAEAAGVRLGLENWPGLVMDHGIQIRNLAYSPAMFERLFAAVPSKAVGLEYDPSHLVWQGADYVGVIHQFADRLVYLHGKDTEVFDEKLAQVGVLGSGWWRYRLPGFGEVDWDAIARALAEVGYTGGIIIEHEDPVFADERFDEGLTLAARFLRQVLKA